MRKRLLAVVLALGLMAMAIPAGAAELHVPHRGTMCENGFKTLHFVHNQHDGEGSLSSVITVDFGAVLDFDFPATKANRGTVHYTIDVEGLGFTTLVNASDDIVPGNLVLSDYECDDDPGSGGYPS